MNAAGGGPLARLLSALALGCASPVRFRIEREGLVIVQRQVTPEADGQLNDIALPALQQCSREAKLDCGAIPRGARRSNCGVSEAFFSAVAAQPSPSTTRAASAIHFLRIATELEFTGCSDRSPPGARV